MSIKDLRYLLALAEHQHFRKAAEACFVSQPTLSGQLKKLEQRLGLVLIDRSARQVQLTPVGELIARQARVTLNHYRQIDEIAKAHLNPLSGPLSLGLIPTISPYLLPRLLPAMSRQFGDIRFEFIEDKTRVLLQRLQDGSLDLAIMANVHELADYRLDTLYHEDFYLAINQQHPWCDKPQVSLAALAGETMLMLADGHCLRDQAMSYCFAAGIDEDASYQGTSLETLIFMIAAGAGMTLLPQLACFKAKGPEARGFERSGITCLPLSERPRREVVLVSRKGFARRELAVQLAQWIARRLQTQLSQ